jgi:zinc finger HIT domain-containing protein 1
MKSLDRIIHEHGYDLIKNSNSNSNIIDIIYNDEDISNNEKTNYISIQSEPSLLPIRHFCSVCGQNGRYSCTRCGMRTCCVKCLDSHKETRCLKFSY